MSYQWEPQIAVLCETEQSFYPQYFSENGKWVTNFVLKPAKSCLKDKLDLLNYCKQVSLYYISMKLFKLFFTSTEYKHFNVVPQCYL